VRGRKRRPCWRRRANEKLASVGQLAAGVAHEINNPIGFIASNLNSLRGYVGHLETLMRAATGLQSAVSSGASDVQAKAELLGRACEEADIEYILEDLGSLVDESIEGTDRVRKIVADLQNFSYIDSPDLTLANVNDIVDQTLSVATNELKYKAEVRRELGDVPDIPCYGDKLGQVLLNLFVNAAQAIETRGVITVRTELRGELVSIEVSDTGCGIAEEHRARVFDPFFTTKPVGSGTGLGLHLSAKIVEAHGGTISVKSTVGEGTTLHIELPVTGPPEQECEETTSGHAA
jgi:signal transduction histidine kinase